MMISAELLQQTGAARCVECGKCVALCPMAETAPVFSRPLSPRGVVQQALAGASTDDMPALAACLQCRSCTLTCPAGVDAAGLIAGLREAAGMGGSVCSRCGAPLPDNTAYLRRTLGETLRSESADGPDGGAYLTLCAACRRQAYIRNNTRGD